MTSLAAAKLLSVAPWFDTDSALSLLSLAPTQMGGAELLTQLRSNGMLVSDRGLERIAEPSRSRWRQELHAQDEHLYTSAVERYLEHVDGEFGRRLRGLLGHDGGTITLFALQYVAGAASAKSIDDVVSTLRLEGEYFDAHRSEATARLIRQYQFKQDRMTDFFEGLAYWSSGRRSEASRLFERVCEDDDTDRAGAIASHLLGVVRYRDGEFAEARRLLSNAVARLDSLHDTEGLVVTLSTLGRTLRSIAEQNDDRDALAESIAALERAYDLSPEGSVKRGRTAQYLAQSYSTAHDYPRAEEAALEAVNLAQSPMDAVNARLALALHYREAGDPEMYVATVEEALAAAEGEDVDAATLARASNMAAAAARREGNLARAESLARRSLAYGHEFNLLNHIPHAAHTLAAVLIDQLDRGEGSGDDVEFANDLLEQAKNALAKRNDRSGLDKVAGTRARLNAILFRGELN